MDVNNTWHYWKQSGHLWTTILVIALFASMTGCHWRAGKEQNVHQAPDRFWKHVQMEMNENTVRSKESRALKKMAEKLKGEED